ncbi:hypothetical protein KXW98_001325 [Aspergillus fumigatus]|nr:hypothetical protein CNMCM8057_000421 [Aspergillus fumigatus]KAF4294161.1 hypothetical protein CNMCM8686_004318 [Aspergillus fumigatus]KAH1276945.1 hypothetical protein KXX45_004214 [Aspergillus fumigatus]KAH1285653.1 hypothetical protein KXX48_000992 [Aspergillus fumigatus]KAH1286108.1 hypothetical protein KXX30_009264 [Aspergillus fumigatus]
MIRLSAETGLKASLGLFLMSCMFLTTSYTTTFAFDRPHHTLIFASFLSGVSLLILSRFDIPIPRIPQPQHKYTAIPLAERADQPSGNAPLALRSQTSDFFSTKSGSRKWWTKIALVSMLGWIRVELYRQVTVKIECAPAGYAYVIPFLVSIYDYWRNRRSRSITDGSDADSEISLDAWIHQLVNTARRLYAFFCQSRMRYVISAAFLMIGGLVASEFQEGIQSTYICPISSGQYSLVRFISILNVLLDSVILIGVSELFRESTEPREGRNTHFLVSCGFGLIGVAAFWTLIAIILAIRARDQNDGFVISYYLPSTFNQSLLMTLLVLSASQLMPFYDIIGISILAGFVIGCFSLAATLFDGQEPFPLIYPSHAFSSLLATSLGGVLYLFGRTASNEEPPFLYRANIVMRVLFSTLFGIGIILVASQPVLTNFHTIELLIYENIKHHGAWSSQAKSSKTLADAVANYRKRYSQHPPPGFDKWYEYATSRASVVIDDFDQIHMDLLPFRALSPARLRDLTRDLATNPFNDIGAISIRNGTPRVQEGIKPTHAWMVLGAAKMIENFAQYLPDMDLAFNLNDEPRVAVPWEEASRLGMEAKSHGPTPDNSVSTVWSADRGRQWAPIEPADQTTETVFTDSSMQPIFDRYIRQLCPPSTKARTKRVWDRRHMCLDCVRPHSMGQFPLDTNSMSDICHQPDLAWLHGFFLSPASFKVSQVLTPVFSQSKVSGFNDILFPSPWNYVDKIKYEPTDEYPDQEYEKKENTLFWIGSTSEGVSRSGAWKGMPRQRFVHLINNNTLSHVSVLLPVEGTDSYRYEVLDGSAPTNLLGLNTTVHILNPVRCGSDCGAQKEELGAASSVDFQSHWKYRYLFDLDGAGFSGRFLPFLQSHSLPFKTGLFRQWLDRRVTPWLHYVPIDVRLHGVWSTLAYFSKFDVPVTEGPDGQPKDTIQRHDARGKYIAEEGRKWAEKALRKEDMEIYFFRLLLEWGRLTDDNRDMLGFKI